MTTLIAGGTGFIGRRLVPLLAQRGEEIVCMDINPQTADYSALGKQVRVVRGDVSQFDDVMARITEAKPNRVDQPRLLHRQRAAAARRVQAQHPRHGQCASRRRGSPAATGSSMPVRSRSAASRNSTATAWSTKTISATATCNTRCTRSSTSGRRRTIAKSTAWRSPRSAPPTSPARTRSSARSTTCSCITNPARGKPVNIALQGRDALARSMSTRSPRFSPASR